MDLVVCSEYPVIQIFSITGLQWFSFDCLKRSTSVGLPFSSQENGVLHFLVIETMRKFIGMRNWPCADAQYQLYLCKTLE